MLITALYPLEMGFYVDKFDLMVCFHTPGKLFTGLIKHPDVATNALRF